MSLLQDNCKRNLLTGQARLTGYQLIRGIIQRSEFNLEDINVTPDSKDLARVPGYQLVLHRRYYKLLIETFHWVVAKLGQLKDLPREALHILSEVMAICFIRVPSVQRSIITAVVTHKYKPKPKSKAKTKKATTEKTDGAAETKEEHAEADSGTYGRLFL